MTSSERARRTTGGLRVRRLRVAGLLIAMAIAAALVHQSLPSSSSTASTSTSAGPPADVVRLAPPQADGERRAALGEAGGAVPDGTTIFDGEIPGVANLDPALLEALRRAATDAADAGVPAFVVTSGWRSAQYQRYLLQAAIAKHGSAREAARWVAAPDRSAHVSGDAVDIGPSDVTAWLSAHGSAYGLCQIYRNEPWHYELRPGAGDRGCPAMYPDAAHG